MDRSCCRCCFQPESMSLSSNFNSLKKITGRAISYILDAPQQNPSLVAYTRYQLPYKYKYRRPAFLELDEDATQASADHEIRPVMHPKRPLVMNTGYAEVINAGKTVGVNEDQSSFQSMVITVPVNRRDETWTTEICQIPCIYFAVFDGHAGSGASLTAHHTLHHHIKEKLTQISHMLVLSQEQFSSRYLATGLITSVKREQLVIGALENAFLSLDEEIKQQRYDFRIDGGCTSVVAVVIQGKLYLANAGDSRGVVYKDYKIELTTRDHTPETERKRIQTLALSQPTLLHNEYTRYQFQHRCRKKDIGSWQLCRDHTMDGWALKLIDKNDMKPQVVCGEGKRARLLDTIGTTRGFGDHDLEVPYAPMIKIKPFLLAAPEVYVYDLESKEFNENDVLVLATDGLWEKFSNERCGEILQDKFNIQSENETRRYIVAAQSLVDEARGVLGERGWRMLNNDTASYDDISTFVIPLRDWKLTLNDILRIHREETQTGRRSIHMDEYLDIPHDAKTPPAQQSTTVQSLKTVGEVSNTNKLEQIPVLVHASERNGDVESPNETESNPVPFHTGERQMEMDKLNHDLDSISRCYDQVSNVDIPALKKSNPAKEIKENTANNTTTVGSVENTEVQHLQGTTNEREKLIIDE